MRRKSQIKATHFPVNSRRCDLLDLTLKPETVRVALWPRRHFSESTHSPLHLSDSLRLSPAFSFPLLSLFMFHYAAYQSPLSLIEECPWLRTTSRVLSWLLRGDSRAAPSESAFHIFTKSVKRELAVIMTQSVKRLLLGKHGS